MKAQRDIFRNITLVFQFGINMLVPIFLCTFLGIFLDRLFSTSFIVIIMFFLGAVAGFRNIFVFAKSSSSRTSYLGSDAEEELKRIGNDGSVKKEDFIARIDRVHKENMHE